MLKKELQTLFDATDLVESHKLVRIEITRDQANQSLTITKTQYIESILEKYGLQDTNTVVSVHHLSQSSNLSQVQKQLILMVGVMLP